MHKFRIISVNKTSEKFIIEGEQEYLKRLKTLSSLEINECNVNCARSLSIPEIKGKEAIEILKRIKPAYFFIALSENGRQFTSTDFSKYLFKKFAEGKPEIVFGIGGAFGWNPSVLERADLVFSLSNLTFPHQIARFLLVEQLYRAISLERGLPYHKHYL